MNVPIARDTEAHPKPTRCSIGWRAFLLTFVPCALLILPLYFHTSGSSQIGTYSVGYFGMLVVVSTSATVLSVVIATLCGRSASLQRAYATLAIMVGVVASLGMVEIALRLVMNDPFHEYKKWGHQKSAIFGYEAQPHHLWKFANATYTTDEFGFRTHLTDQSWSRSSGQRIFVLGGSSAFGFGLNDDETWAHLLEGNLRADLKDQSINVINAGNNGHNSLQSLLRFYLKVLPLKPDFLLYYEGINDVDESILGPKSIWVSDDTLFSETMTSYLSKQNANKNLYARTLLAYVLDTKLTRRKKQVGQSALVEQKLSAAQIKVRDANGRRFITNVTTLADMCRRHSVKLVLITFIYDDVNMPVYHRETLKYYNQLLRNLARSESIPLIDLEKHFRSMEDKKAYFFEDHYHPSRQGARYIAKVVGSEMQRLLKKPTIHKLSTGSDIP